MKQNNGVDELRAYLHEKLKEHKKKDANDYNSLIGELIEWGAAVVYSGTLYDAIKNQIEFQAEKKRISPKNFLENLFSLNNYCEWMRAFQL